MAVAWGWTLADVLGLTLRQVRYYQSEGKLPDRTRREFDEFGDYLAWKARMDKAWDDYQWDSN